jgi:hypothetical protein
MDYAACCPELNNLIAKPDKGTGLGLVIVTAKWGMHFILVYRTDWRVPRAEDSIQIAFCPFCGAKLQLHRDSA